VARLRRDDTDLGAAARATEFADHGVPGFLGLGETGDEHQAHARILADEC
jgi:hypothetical protein